jgi:uncharacterized protein
MLTETSIIEETVRINGQGRVLDGNLAYPADQAMCSALIAGPHPFLGGDRRNNVVRSLSEALSSQGAVALSFDYGGVGASEGGPSDWPAVMSTFWKDGTFKEEGDWADDAGSALASLRTWSDLPRVLVGYSFGCWTVTKNLSKSCAEAIVLISPNPEKHSFDELATCRVPLLLIHNDNDFTCSVSDMTAWFDSIRQPKTRVQLPASEHFFRGHEKELTNVVVEFLSQHGVLGGE